MLAARRAVLAAIDGIAAGAGTELAIASFVRAARDRTLSPELQAAVAAANARAGAGARTISVRTLKRWRAEAKAGDLTALAPKAPAEAPVPLWAGPTLKEYRRPQKPALAQALREMELPPGIERPSYDQARRFLERVSPVEVERGRRGPNALRDIRPYVKRDTRDLWPTDIYIGDGHTFDAEIAHPGHGNPFRPEVTSVLDVATRKCVGWSVELSENCWAVADAIRMATSTHGVAAIYYSDRGPGERNAHLDDAATGLLGRIGTSHEFSIARRSQARGVIEAFHRHLTALAKSSPTYMGEAMDKDARQAVYKLTRADLKRNGSARLLPPWRDFVAALAAAIDQYNTRPHSSLPKILDPATGQRRHQTPSEAWEAAVARGFEPVTLPAAEIEDLFRPHEIRRCRRGLVSLWGGEYFARALEHYHGDRVAVGYDIHDPAKVWIRDLEGRLIATAELAGHARPYMPASRIEVARKIRGQAQIKRLDAQRARVAADLGTGPALIEHAPAVELTPEQLAEADAAFARLEACGGADGGAVANDDTPPLDAAGSAARPVFGDDLAFVRWVAEHPQAATAADTTLLRGLLRGKSFRRLLEFEGVDLAALETIAC